LRTVEKLSSSFKSSPEVLGGLFGHAHGQFLFRLPRFEELRDFGLSVPPMDCAVDLGGNLFDSFDNRDSAHERLGGGFLVCSVLLALEFGE
jgi:hypothetical protein